VRSARSRHEQEFPPVGSSSTIIFVSSSSENRAWPPYGPEVPLSGGEWMRSLGVWQRVRALRRSPYNHIDQAGKALIEVFLA
jgi:hypothetical protein